MEEQPESAYECDAATDAEAATRLLRIRPRFQVLEAATARPVISFADFEEGRPSWCSWHYEKLQLGTHAVTGPGPFRPQQLLATVQLTVAIVAALIQEYLLGLVLGSLIHAIRAATSDSDSASEMASPKHYETHVPTLCCVRDGCDASPDWGNAALFLLAKRDAKCGLAV